MSSDAAVDITAETNVCSLLTPRGEGGIAVVHVRGPGAVEIVDRIFHGRRVSDLRSSEPGHLLLGHLIDGDDTLDEVMVARLPHTEPAVEIHCHAGSQSVKRIVGCLAKFGVKEIGEPDYWARQVACGETDFIQQEAAALLPHARSSLALGLLLTQYAGALSDFVRQTADGAAPPAALDRLLEGPRLGEALCDPRRVVIVGPTNAGKSSLFNALLKDDRVITTDVPGTTRDAIEEDIVTEGIPLTLVDTAGLRETEHPIESMAIQVSKRALEQAHAAIFLFDASVGFPEGVIRDYRQVVGRGIPVIAAVNKVDLGGPFTPQLLGDSIDADPLAISALRGDGLDALCRRLVDTIAPQRTYSRGDPAIFTARQHFLLEELARAMASGKQPSSPEVQGLCRGLLHGPEAGS